MKGKPVFKWMPSCGGVSRVRIGDQELAVCAVEYEGQQMWKAGTALYADLEWAQHIAEQIALSSAKNVIEAFKQARKRAKG